MSYASADQQQIKNKFLYAASQQCFPLTEFPLTLMSGCLFAKIPHAVPKKWPASKLMPQILQPQHLFCLCVAGWMNLAQALPAADPYLVY